jgi:hypothetical protein
MNARFKRLTMAGAIALGLAGAGGPAGAAVLGGAGEALLVPLAVWSNGKFLFPDPATGFTAPAFTPAVDTIIELIVPAAVGSDQIPNVYTARHTTPTSVVDGLAPPVSLDPGTVFNATGTVKVHWYWFNKRSAEPLDGTFLATPDDVIQISLTDLAQGRRENQPGYILFADDAAKDGSPATFSMFANAWLTGQISADFVDIDGNLQGLGFPLIGGSIPVLAMNDGQDPAPYGFGSCPPPNGIDSVTYNSSLRPCGIVPVSSGFRTNDSDGIPQNFAFNLTLSNRILPTIHVVWVDHNLDSPSAIKAQYPANLAVADPSVSVEVYDTDEVSCSDTVSLPNEVNVIWIPPAYLTEAEADVIPFYQPFLWTTGSKLLCVPGFDPNGPPQLINPALFNAGFVQYRLPEYLDTGNFTDRSAAFAFSLKIDGGFTRSRPGIYTNFYALFESAVGHDLGLFGFGL